jgi:hypothetical protein
MTLELPIPHRMDGSKKKEETTTKDNTVLVNEQIKASVAIIALLDEQSKPMKQLYDLEKLKIPDGRTHAMSLILTYTRHRMVHLDFVKGEIESRGIPSGSNISYSYTKLFTLIIYNDGPADIVFSTNRSTNSTDATSTVESGTSTTIDFDYAVLENLNISLATTASSNAAVRLIGLT